ncbi:MAG TPA: STM3941 family protein [Mucilaginibacter sp.]|nr:STM3941 family protein [Mucilaginibacter sp.]
MPEIKLYKSKWKAIRLILLCLPWVLVCLYLINKNDSSIGCFGLCFFGLGIPIGLFNLLDNRPRIIINEIGIFDRLAYKDFINWEIIKDAYLKKLQTSRLSQTSFICLVVDEDTLDHLKINKTRRAMNTLSKNMGFQELNLEIGQLNKVDPGYLLEFIKAMLVAGKTKREELILDSKL